MNFNFTSFFMMVDFLEQVKASHQVFSGMLFFAVLRGMAVSEDSSGTEHRKTPRGLGVSAFLGRSPCSPGTATRDCFVVAYSQVRI
jgi:hypothetical protein